MSRLKWICSSRCERVIELEKCRSISRWISENYADAEKIVEVGIGKYVCVIEELEKRLPNCRLIATDVLSTSAPKGVEFVLDDITDPRIEIYKDADLIYSLSTPPELQPHLKELVENSGSDLLINTVSSEESPVWGRLVNQKGISFYIFR